METSCKHNLLVVWWRVWDARREHFVIIEDAFLDLEFYFSCIALVHRIRRLMTINWDVRVLPLRRLFVMRLTPTQRTRPMWCGPAGLQGQPRLRHVNPTKSDTNTGGPVICTCAKLPDVVLLDDPHAIDCHTSRAASLSFYSIIPRCSLSLMSDCNKTRNSSFTSKKCKLARGIPSA